MTFGGGRTLRVVLIAMLGCPLGPMSVAGQTAPGPGPQMSDTVFQNVQVLKGIPVDEFMDTMGMFSASLGFDCISCHSPDISTKALFMTVWCPDSRSVESNCGIPRG